MLVLRWDKFKTEDEAKAFKKAKEKAKEDWTCWLFKNTERSQSKKEYKRYYLMGWQENEQDMKENPYIVVWRKDI